MAQTNGPVKTFPLGRIKAKIWANPTKENGVWFNVEIVRVAKEGDQFKQYTQFGRNDLSDVAMAAVLAIGWIIEQEVPARDRKVNE